MKNNTTNLFLVFKLVLTIALTTIPFLYRCQASPQANPKEGSTTRTIIIKEDDKEVANITINSTAPTESTGQLSMNFGKDDTDAVKAYEAWLKTEQVKYNIAYETYLAYKDDQLYRHFIDKCLWVVFWILFYLFLKKMIDYCKENTILEIEREKLKK